MARVKFDYGFSPISRDERQFRLITLQPMRSSSAGHDDDKLYCTIAQASIDDPPIYDCLSYHWGLSKVTSRILVEVGDGELREISITDTLATCLRSLSRGAHQRRVLFVDQICINQADAIEKGLQVQLMGQIYSGATHVLAWLGPATPNSAGFVDFVSRMGPTPCLSRIAGIGMLGEQPIDDLVAALKGDEGVFLEPEERVDLEELRALLLAERADIPYRGMLDFFARPWFRRVWILQEACLGPRLVFLCGADACVSDDVQHAMYFVSVAVAIAGAGSLGWREKDTGLVLAAWDAYSFVRRIFRLRDSVQRRGDRLNHSREMSLWELVSRYNVTYNAMVEPLNPGTHLKWRATDPRDCIYGLRGLAADRDKVLQRLSVEYDRHSAEVYTQFAAAAVIEHVDLLLFAQHDVAPQPMTVADGGLRFESHASNLFSWVPDWSAELRVPHGYYDDMNGKPAFRAGGALPDRPEGFPAPRVDGPELVLSGVFVDVVETAGQHYIEVDRVESARIGGKHIDTESIARFLTEAAECCDIATAKGNRLGIHSRFKREAVLLRLTTGGLGLSTYNNLGEQPVLGPEFQGRPLAAYLHEQLLAYSNIIVRQHRLARDIAYRHTLVRAEAGANQTCGFAYGFQLSTLVLPKAAGWVWGYWKQRLPFMFRNGWRWLKSKLLRPYNKLDERAIRLGLARVHERMPDYRNALSKQRERRCFVTKTGFIGLGPKSMRRGDVLVVLFGGTTPHILRPRLPHFNLEIGVQDLTRYSYIGEAYCEGIMEGAMLDSKFAAQRTEFRLI